MAYVPWMRPGFELGLAMQEICRKQPEGQGHHDGPARLHLLGRRRQGMLPAHARLHREGVASSSRRSTRTRAATRRRSAAQNIRRSRRKSAAKLFAAILPWLRGQVSQQKRFIGTVQDDEKILRFVNSHDAPRLAELGTSCPDHFLRTKIKPLYVDWNPQTEDVGRAQEEARRRPRAIPQGLRGLLREVQTRQLARHARPESDRHPDSRPRHDRLGQGQERIARHGRILQLRRRSHARRGGDRRIHRAAAAGSLRHRILAARRGEAQAHAGGKGTGAAGHRRHRRRLRHRQGNRASPREGRRAHRLRRPERGRGARPPRRKSPTNTASASAWPAAGISGCGPAIGLACDITDRASIRAMLDQVALAYGGFDSICVTAGIFVPSDTTGHIPDDKWALDLRHQRHRQLPRRATRRRRPGRNRACAAISC